MLKINIESVGDIRILQRTGGIVRSEAAFKLREAVTSQRDARGIVLDLSEVRAIEGGGLRDAVVSAAMGVRTQHSAEAVQPHQLREGQAAVRPTPCRRSISLRTRRGQWAKSSEFSPPP
jgi:hypothetical protein